MNPGEISIHTKPPLTAVQQLLEQAGLPSQDLCADDMQRFLYVGPPDHPDAIIGMEIFGSDALVRSLVVRPEMRGHGHGAALVYTLEDLAKSMGVEVLYLLALGSEAFFTRLGYRPLPRNTAPAAIKATPQFSSLCPADAVMMKKHL